MNYDKLSRSIRQYYKKGIIRKPDVSRRLVYQFVNPVWWRRPEENSAPIDMLDILYRGSNKNTMKHCLHLCWLPSEAYALLPITMSLYLITLEDVSPLVVLDFRHRQARCVLYNSLSALQQLCSRLSGCVCVVCFPTINVMLSLFIFNSNNYEHLSVVVMIGYERTDTGAVAEVNWNR